jgi:diguanylate cyclase (GGDEF)-like protein
VDWSKLPDLVAVALLTVAFASVARRGRNPVSGLWLTAWGMIALHFVAFMFAPFPGVLGNVAGVIGLTSLTWAGILFMWASVPYRTQNSSPWMMAILLGTNTLYILILVLAPNAVWALILSAALFGVLPLTLTLVTFRHFNHLLRWTTVFLYVDLSIFLLAVQLRHGNGADLALNAVLFTVYFGCGIHFWHTYRRATAGAFITIAAFFLWAAVFVVGPIIATYLPNLHLENEVWNLPKYIAAVGMILLLLEDQIEHNKYLALHDELTGLPNRRLFQDRLNGAIERARRSRSRAALLLIDLNEFKQVNDTAGHHAGDLLLKRAGEIFLGRARRSDTVARTGGDEFSLILEEPISREDAERVAHSLSQLLDGPVQAGQHTLQVGASIGIAIYPEDADSAESLYIAADRSMYTEKRRPKAELVEPPSLDQPTGIANVRSASPSTR